MAYNKIVRSPKDLRAILDERVPGRTVVLTKGVYDLLHIGHLSSLSAAKALGDVLVVGVNSDSAVKIRKGHDRPIVDQESRMLLIAGLACVDWVTLYEEVSPRPLAEEINPTIFAVSIPYLESASSRDLQQTGTYKIVQIPEYLSGWSTTSLVSRIKRQ
jgi:rfaE bifunctional protein nucleotidyltransferase chain/domain